MKILFFLGFLRIGDEIFNEKLVFHQLLYSQLHTCHQHIGLLMIIIGSLILLSVPINKKIGFSIIFFFILLAVSHINENLNSKLEFFLFAFAIIAYIFFLMDEHDENLKDEKKQKILKNEATKKNLQYHNNFKYRVSL